MIKFENVEVFGWEAAIRGMRNPMNSWDNMDSETIYESWYDMSGGKFEIGKNDLELMKRLRTAGTDHRKFMRMIEVYVDITAPLYWWKEFDTYKVGTVANSCSTMHKIAEKEFKLDDFSCEHLFDDNSDYHNKIWCNTAPITEEDLIIDSTQLLKITIEVLNAYRSNFINTKDKSYWWQMIQLLPSSYNQKRTVMMSYEVLANIYKSRKYHKLDEWREFCKWIKTLPYSELITGEENKSCSEE